MNKKFEQALHAAIAKHQQGSLAEAAQQYKTLLRQQPKHPDLLHLLGVISYQENRLDEARELIGRAIEVYPDSAQFHCNLGNVWQAMQRYAEAVPCYEKAVELDAARGSANPVILCNLGNALLALLREAEAAAVFEQALAIAPNDPAVLSCYGLLLKETERPAEALDYFVRVLEQEPESIAIHINLGNTLRMMKVYPEALQQYVWVLQRYPEHIEAHYNMALTRRLAGDVSGALAQLQYSLNLDERYASAHHAMVTILETETDHAATLDVFQQALKTHPQSAQLHSVIAYSTDFDPALSAADQQKVRKEWYAQQIVPRGIAPRDLLVSREPEKKLRIGFIPGRFYRNASVYAYLPVILQLDREHFEVWCYDGFHTSDEFTAAIQSRADGWCDIARMSDAEVAQRIRDDRIDILVDLFAHAGANRLSIYAYKPAPIQVTAWGHANGTGMACMDYLFSDPVSIPPEEVGFYAEHVHYLPCQLSFWLPEDAPQVKPLPMEKSGFITFGCFNRMIKVSDSVLELWAQILSEVPRSRLVLKAAELVEPAQQERVLAIFRRHGVLPGRLVFYSASPWFEHLERYAEIDIALDPFPMGGGVTTLDALWMGVPVICLRGKTLGQRITSAIMTAVGLSDWVCDSIPDYLALAKIKAAELVALQHLRQHLRLRMVASPLANPEYYVHCVEGAFRAFWRQWCADPGIRVPNRHEASFDVPVQALGAHTLWQKFLCTPDNAEVRQEVSAMLKRVGKNKLAAELSAAAPF